jgi:hypothetical protein
MEWGRSIPIDRTSDWPLGLSASIALKAILALSSCGSGQDDKGLFRTSLDAIAKLVDGLSPGSGSDDPV